MKVAIWGTPVGLFMRTVRVAPLSGQTGRNVTVAVGVGVGGMVGVVELICVVVALAAGTSVGLLVHVTVGKDGHGAVGALIGGGIFVRIGLTVGVGLLVETVVCVGVRASVRVRVVA